MGTIVNKTIQEATARLKENYEAQKILICHSAIVYRTGTQSFRS